MSNLLTFQPPIEGRLVDLLMFHTDTPFQTTQVGQQLTAAPGGTVTAGLQKLAQTVAIRLYTGINGKVYEPNEGNAFGDLLRNGQISTLEDVRTSFAVAANSIRNQYYQDKLTYPDIPADELPDSISLLDASIDGDELSLVISVVSAAGTSAQFTFPVTAI